MVLVVYVDFLHSSHLRGNARCFSLYFMYQQYTSLSNLVCLMPYVTMCALLVRLNCSEGVQPLWCDIVAMLHAKYAIAMYM